MAILTHECLVFVWVSTLTQIGPITGMTPLSIWRGVFAYLSSDQHGHKGMQDAQR